MFNRKLQRLELAKFSHGFIENSRLELGEFSHGLIENEAAGSLFSHGLIENEGADLSHAFLKGRSLTAVLQRPLENWSDRKPGWNLVCFQCPL